jgi:glycosyltransferase involved in cell wall biosynthesis
MRLLVVSTWVPYPPDNGSKMRAFNLLKRLSARHEITLLCLGDSPRAADVVAIERICSRVAFAPVTAVGPRLGMKGLLSPTPRHFVQTDSPVMRRLIAEHLPQHDVAIGMQVDAARYLRGASIPRVFEEVEVTLLREQVQQGTSLSRKVRHRLTWWKFRRYIRDLVNDFECSTVVSEAEREQLRKIGCDVNRVSVVPNGIDASRPDVAVVQPPRLIYPGSVRYSANLDAVEYFVRDVWPLVRQRRPDATFWVTGSTEGVDISALAAVGGVTFAGTVDDIDSTIATSAVCVVPLRQGGGTRLKVLHALALGTPVVSTTKGAEGLEVEAGRHLLVGDRPQSFAGQILSVLSDRELRARLAKQGSELVQSRYAWDGIVETLERLLQAAAAGRIRVSKVAS